MQYFTRVTRTLGFIVATGLYASYASADAALEALNASRFDEARTLYLQQLTKPDTQNAALTYLAKVEIYAGNYDKAIEYLQQAIKAEPQSAVNYLLLGRAYGEKAQTGSKFSAFGLAKDCLKSFETAHEKDPKNIEALQALVGFHSGAPSIVGGSTEKLAQYLGELKKLSPDHATMVEVEQLEKNKQHAQAMLLARELKQKKNLPVDLQFSLANFFKNNKEYGDAEEVLEYLIKTPVTAETRLEYRWFISDASLQLGEVFLATHKQLDRAIMLVKDFQAKNNNPKDVHYLWAFWSLAKLYKANGEIDKYNAEVAHIKTLDYKKNKVFAQRFEDELKN